jgi:hypothetical protein
VDARLARTALSPATTRSFPECRAHARYCLSLAVKVVERSTFRVLQALVVEASSRRIGLLLGHSVQVGALLTVFPLQPQLGQSPALTVHVVSAQPQPGSNCYAACAILRPLTQAELNEFLA